MNVPNKPLATLADRLANVRTLFLRTGRAKVVGLSIIGFSLIAVTILAHSRSKTSRPMADPMPSSVPSRIEVEVVNGTGEPRLAERFTELLRSRGFDVVDMGNAAAPVQKSLVIDRSGSPESARKVAESLHLPKDRLIQKPDKSLYLDVSLVVGKDYSSLRLLQE